MVDIANLFENPGSDETVISFPQLVESETVFGREVFKIRMVKLPAINMISMSDQGSFLLLDRRLLLRFTQTTVYLRNTGK